MQTMVSRELPLETGVHLFNLVQKRGNARIVSCELPNQITDSSTLRWLVMGHFWRFLNFSKNVMCRFKFLLYFPLEYSM